MPVNTYTARSILLGHLVADDHEDLLSPHLLSPRSAPVPSLCMATTAWLNIILHRMGLSYRAVTGDSKDVPADQAVQQEASIKRIAGKVRLWGIRQSCVVFADETYLNYGQHQE